MPNDFLIKPCDAPLIPTAPLALLLARLLCGMPVDVDAAPDPLRAVLNETLAQPGSRVDAFRASAAAHGLDAAAWINAAAALDPNATPAPDTPLVLLSADAILRSEFAEPVWVVPDLLPVGLCILAGAPKLGKSWLGLQLALAIASGGLALGTRVERKPILYLALEDPPRRLKERMLRQRWTLGLPADFMPLGQFDEQIGDLTDGGGEKLARQIERCGYGLVVVDTLSRAVKGDQLDAQDMTRGLTPLQEIAHAHHCAVLMIDHHRKTGGYEPDAVADILGSTAKGAMTDTAWGLYRERGKAGAKLAITGREIAERTLALTMDWELGCWQMDGDADAIAVTDRQQEILDALESLGSSRCQEIAKAVGQDKSNTHKRLQELLEAGQVTLMNSHYSLT